MAFPIAVLYTGHNSLCFITDPKDLPKGDSFKIILTDVTSVQFQIADETCKAILKNQC